MTDGIDLPLFDISTESESLARDLTEAASKWGFLWVTCAPYDDGQNVDSSSTLPFQENAATEIFNLSASFFREEVASEKEKCRIRDNKGWVSMNLENLDPVKQSKGDFKQAFNLAEPTLGQWTQSLPRVFRDHEDSLATFHRGCRQVADRILRLIARGLGLSDPDWLVERHKDGENILRLLYYPDLSGYTNYSSLSDIRAGAHSDYGSITLLFQQPGQPGLEILTSETQSIWAAVPVFPPNYPASRPPPIVVNIGDLLSYWTNGSLRSTIHRVVCSASPETAGGDTRADCKLTGAEDRFSIAVFVQPHDATRLDKLPVRGDTSLVPGTESRDIGHGGGTKKLEQMREMTAGDYLQSRLRATYQ